MQQILKLSNKGEFIFCVLLLQQRLVRVAKRGSMIPLQHTDVTKVKCQFCSVFLSCEQYIVLTDPFESISELAFSNRGMESTIK